MRTKLEPMRTTYQVVQLTNHWRLYAGRHYRDAWVRLASGDLELIAIRDDLLGGDL